MYLKQHKVREFITFFMLKYFKDFEVSLALKFNMENKTKPNPDKISEISFVVLSGSLLLPRLSFPT